MADQNQTIEILFGKGVYAITSHNVAKLRAKLDNFQKTGVWQWCLVDNLGIARDGSKKPRCNQIIAYPSENEEFKMLQEALKAYVAPESITHPTQRMETAEKQKALAEAAAKAKEEADKIAQEKADKKAGIIERLQMGDDVTDEEKAFLMAS
jgi:hypothetical protein